ncbi:diacylglycerol kinase 5 [Actinidia rufa]|uniref:Diacylglycerol kinase 5 n=1 Tax=Actinidia rufa TaxID=165716 RepID=A0A7J0F242_9ERIC|nr:diacylglycerol kinase 5 [Actinidia rufa]
MSSSVMDMIKKGERSSNQFSQCSSLVMTWTNDRGTALSQLHVLEGLNRIRFLFHKGETDHTYMRIDGEPWKQPLPVDNDAIVVEISHLGQVNMLATPHRQSNIINDPSSPYLPDDNSNDRNNEEADETWEERRKVGAAETFRFPDGIDLARLS